MRVLQSDVRESAPGLPEAPVVPPLAEGAAAGEDPPWPRHLRCRRVFAGFAAGPAIADDRLMQNKVPGPRFVECPGSGGLVRLAVVLLAIGCGSAPSTGTGSGGSSGTGGGGGEISTGGGGSGLMGGNTGSGGASTGGQVGSGSGGASTGGHAGSGSGGASTGGQAGSGSGGSGGATCPLPQSVCCWGIVDHDPVADPAVCASNGTWVCPSGKIQEPSISSCLVRGSGGNYGSGGVGGSGGAGGQAGGAGGHAGGAGGHAGGAGGHAGGAGGSGGLPGLAGSCGSGNGGQGGHRC